MHGVQGFCYLAAGMLAFIFSGVLINCMAYFCNRIHSQRRAALGGQPADTSGGFREVVMQQSSSSSVEVVVDKGACGGKERNESLSNCTICICQIEDGEICWELSACNHTFHAECIQKWLKKNKTCPLCRTNIILVHAL